MTCGLQKVTLRTRQCPKHHAQRQRARPRPPVACYCQQTCSSLNEAENLLLNKEGEVSSELRKHMQFIPLWNSKFVVFLARGQGTMTVVRSLSFLLFAGPTRRKAPDSNRSLFHRRLQHESSWKGRENEAEPRTLRLEQMRLELEKEKLEQHIRESHAECEVQAEEKSLRFEEITEQQQQRERERQERAEERRIFLARQEALLRVRRSIIPQAT